jgi:hypothetical protein
LVEIVVRWWEFEGEREREVRSAHHKAGERRERDRDSGSLIAMQDTLELVEMDYQEDHRQAVARHQDYSARSADIKREMEYLTQRQVKMLLWTEKFALVLAFADYSNFDFARHAFRRYSYQLTFLSPIVTGGHLLVRGDYCQRYFAPVQLHSRHIRDEQRHSGHAVQHLGPGRSAALLLGRQSVDHGLRGHRPVHRPIHSVGHNTKVLEVRRFTSLSQRNLVKEKLSITSAPESSQFLTGVYPPQTR